MMNDRPCLPLLRAALAEAPVVALLGPHRVGKTTLVRALAAEDAEVSGAAPLYLDLDQPADRTRLAEPEDYLGAQAGRWVILDGIERMPGWLPIVRRLASTDGRGGPRFLLTGSAAMARLTAAGDAGTHGIRMLEMLPLSAAECPPSGIDLLWLRGGIPDSLSAATDADSLRVRQDVIGRDLDRDLLCLAPRIAAESLRRCWMMLAHRTASPLNQAELARALGVDGKTVAAWLDLLVDLFLVRRLQPWQRDSAKRLVRTPKAYVRDSGLVHALLGIDTRDRLLGHPIVGRSWEGFVVESLLAAAPAGTQACFYRTAVGAGIDLVLTVPGKGPWAIEITRSLRPTLDRGFHHACEDVQPDAGFVVHPGPDRQTLAGGVEGLPLAALIERLRQSV